jgi:hypothetical protein
MNNDDSTLQQIAWNAFATLAAVVAAVATRKLAEILWARFGSGDVPRDPTDPDITWSQATGWALLAGAAAGVARVVGKRGAAIAWRRVTGNEAPPGTD